MRTISAVDLRNDLEGIVKLLRKGEHLALTYRGETVAEMVPAKSVPKLSPIEALKRAQAITSQDPLYTQKAETYLRELREDQKAWGERSP
jgi:antitoxin (DNA-binding transcriptional repressor) of toxin-antitoxin stability system